ncbi:MAG: hypothetical protein JKY02_05785 [Flavobacteriaceae bacterium]|nr:hypothetical protein [Flavobacteriaceae bacterium]
MKNTIYIGLNDTFHDPAICILNHKGEIIYCESVERFLQYKRALGVNSDADFFIEHALKSINYKAEDIVIGTAWSKGFKNIGKFFSFLDFFNPYSNLFYVKYLMKKIPSSFFYIANRAHSSCNSNGIGTFFYIKDVLKLDEVNLKKLNFNHHTTHIVNALSVTEITEPTIGLVIDGKGEKGSISIFEIENNERVKIIKEFKSKFSLGDFYSIITMLTGYDMLKGEEWKVMGLSAYGKLNEELYDALKKIFIVKGNKFYTSKLILTPKLKILYQLVEEKSISKEDIAKTGQFLFEEYLIHLVKYCKKLLPNRTQILVSGGTALNSLALGSLSESGIFKKVIVPNAPADDGNAIGAAYLAYKKTNGHFPKINKSYRSPFTGTEIKDSEIEKYTELSGLPFKKVENPEQAAAKLLHENKIIGWIQGKAEFGPRSLGNRSILANPCYAENKNRINAVVKFREGYRPFAPSILNEYGNDYFEKYSFTPYMEKTLTFKDSVRDKVPAVVHEDGTGRLQSVTEEMNSKYHTLISEFYKLSGVPVIVNTSYNVMGKPIAHNINDVMSVFFNSKIDAVFIGNFLIERNN